MYRQIVDQVSALVASGQLHAGERLPSVRELASQILVSIITVRRAYADLESLGLIVSRQGRGTFVAENVEVATRSHARREALRAIVDAVSRARQLGLGDEEIRDMASRVLDRPSDHPFRT